MPTVRDTASGAVSHSRWDGVDFARLRAALQSPSPSDMLSAHPSLDVPTIVERELQAVQEQLTLARQQLRDGILKLAGHFEQLQRATAQQESLLSAFAGISDEIERDAALSEISRLQCEMRASSTSAVLGLQLEDVMGQLLDHTHGRLTRLAAVATAITELLQGVDNQQRQQAAAQLGAVLADVERQALGCAVEQSSLAAGDVELF
jgi:hypothetical protein